ncbi:MAG: cytochrome P450 [Rhizobiaceae bacterium]
MQFPPKRECPFHPPDAYRNARESEPVSRVTLWDGSRAWLFTRYDDVREILGDPRFSPVATRPGYPFVTEARRAVLLGERPNINFMDPPEHTKFRRIVAPIFLAQKVSAMRPLVQSLVDNLVDAMEAKGPPADLVDDFALELPVHVIAHMVGVPVEQSEVFLEAAKARFDLSSDPSVPLRAAKQLWGYLDAHLALKEAEAEPSQDVTSKLAREQVQTGNITRTDAIMILYQLLVAGHDTSANMISMGVLNLLRKQDQLAKLKADWTRLPGAVDELLRFISVLQFHAMRTATEDIEVGGQVVRSGEGVIASLPAANRDPAVFQNPDVIDVERSARNHMAFSYGIHQCVGQSLARMELEIAFETLWRRFPNLALAEPIDEITYGVSNLSFGPRTMKVGW